MALRTKLSNGFRRLSHRRGSSRTDDLTLATQDGGRAGDGEQKRGANAGKGSGQGISIGEVDPDALASLPIGAAWGDTPGTSAVLVRSPEGTSKIPSVFSDASTTDSPANSFDSIDTISDRSGRDSPDIAAETHRRTKKLLKYSRWIRNRTQNGDGDAGNDKSVLALERKMARQEEKLNALHLDRK